MFLALDMASPGCKDLARQISRFSSEMPSHQFFDLFLPPSCPLHRQECGAENTFNHVTFEVTNFLVALFIYFEDLGDYDPIASIINLISSLEQVSTCLNCHLIGLYFWNLFISSVFLALDPSYKAVAQYSELVIAFSNLDSVLSLQLVLRALMPLE